MTIIDAWRQMTTCKDCCKGLPGSIGLVYCGLLPKDVAYPMPKGCRCDSGLWLFRNKTPRVIGGPYEIPFDLKDWLDIRVGINPDTYTLIPREEWPGYDHA